MGAIARDYLRDMHGFETRAEIKPEVDAAVKKVFGESADFEAEFTEEEITVAFNQAVKELTESEIENAADDLVEAKTTYPKNKQIKSMIALKKKLKAKVAAIRHVITDLKNSRSVAQSNKNRSKVIGYGKQIKKLQADVAKQGAVHARAEDQYKKLVADRKAYNKKNAAAKKADKKPAPAKKAA